MTAIPFPVGKGESEVVERRSSAWSDPRTWVSICAVLLTVVLFALGTAIKELSDLHADVRTILVSQARDDGRLNAYEERIKVLENFKETQEKAYNFTFTTRLAGAESDIRSLQNQSQSQQQKRGK